MQTLPHTKFSPPLPHRERISRPNLSRRLLRDLPSVKLVLISAPAGYGKTTLLAALPELLPDYALAWLNIDADDNDPARFAACLAKAFAGLLPGLERAADNPDALTSLAAGVSSGAALQQTVTRLINAAVELPLPPAVLVLDDLHEISSPAIYAALDYLLDHLPPQLHIMLATRHEPPLHLGRLRARRQICEFSALDLRFDLEESQRFLNGSLHLALEETEVSTLQEKTEGWPAGLVLMTGRLRGLATEDQRAAFFKALDPIDSNTFNYLAEEILNQQPEPLRTFLLETSLLGEFTPALCRRVTDRGDAQALIEEAYRRNLFLTLVRERVGEEEAVYRYHALFSSYLQRELTRLGEAAVRDLHRRAAAAETAPGRVISHLLAANEWTSAAETIEAVGEDLLQQGMHETLSAWINALPQECVHKRSALLYLRGMADLLRGDLEAARASLERSLAVDEPASTTVARGEVLTSLATLYFVSADFKHSSELIRQAETGMAGAKDRIEYLMLRASLALFWESDWTRAGSDLREAMGLVQASENLQWWYRFVLYLGPEFAVLPGMLDDLEAFCESGRRRFGVQVSPLRLGVEDTLASLQLRRGRLTQAIETGRSAQYVKQQLGGYLFLGMNSALAAAAACTGIGNYAAAEEYLDSALAQVRSAELNQALAAGGLYPLGKLYWLQGRRDEAARVYSQLAGLQPRLPLADVLQKMLGGLLEMGDKRHRAAEKLLLQAVELQSKEWVSRIYGSARLLLAVLYQRWGKTQLALDYLGTELARCEREQTRGEILQEMPLVAPLLRLALQHGLQPQLVRGLLEQMGQPLEESGAAMETLTERQVEILRLMAAGKSNQAIADALTLSLATVKSHVVHIMNRLGASSRTEAVACAREKGLL